MQIGETEHTFLFIAEKENGIVRYVDPQTGSLGVSNYFSFGVPGNFGYFRMDNKNITDDVNIINDTVELKKT